MSNPLQSVMAGLIWLVALVAGVALFIVGFVVFAYIFIFLAVLGLVMYGLAYLRARWMLHQAKQSGVFREDVSQDQRHVGHTYDQDDFTDNNNNKT